MAAPADPKKPPAPAAPSSPAAGPAPARTVSGELGVAPAARYTGPDPRVCCGLLQGTGPQDQALDVVAHVTGGVVPISLGAEAFPALRGAVRTHLDTNLKPGEKPLAVGGVAPFELDVALARFQDRAYAVARVGPGVPLGDSDESTQTGLQKVAWKLPRPC